ncbi:uncharacterized protein LOC142616677 [Castanea sativa]|uniref:uncharacterized protein LOC142616677 n=1 Tax=Castanea sativa TaxID=21020 RepID=UPI003F64A815
MIRDRLRAAQSRQKSYYDIKRKALELEIGGKVFLRVAPMKGVMRFGKKGKLSPRFVGPFEVLERVGEIAYRISLPLALLGIHNVFHESMLRKYIPGLSHVLRYEPLQIRDDLSYEEIQVEILNLKEQVLRNRTISWVKVFWKNHLVKETSWEHEDVMLSRYPNLVEDQGLLDIVEVLANLLWSLEN